MQGAGDAPHSEFEQRSFSGLAAPLVCIGRGRFLAADFRPFAGQVGINLEKLLLILGDVFLWHDGIDRAFRHTQSAINALFGVNYQEIRPLMEAFDGADFHAVGVLALDTVFKDDESHESGMAGRTNCECFTHPFFDMPAQVAASLIQDPLDLESTILNRLFQGVRFSAYPSGSVALEPPLALD